VADLLLGFEYRHMSECGHVCVHAHTCVRACVCERRWARGGGEGVDREIN